MTPTLVRAALVAGLAAAASAALAAEIILYERPGFQGRSMTLRGNTADLDRTRFNDRAESIVVRDGVWEVCTDARYGGRCVRLQPGEYPTLDGPLNDRISSAREVAQYAPPAAVVAPPPPGPSRGGGRAVLYEGPDFRGRAFEIDRPPADDAGEGVTRLAYLRAFLRLR